MIYVFFAHGFEEIEAITPLDILRRAELEVQAVGVGAKTITGSHGITVHCDISDREATSKNLEMIVLPGGMPGTLNLEKSRVVSECIDYVAKSNIWLSAICAAPSILGHKGLLNGKKATCFPGFEDQLEGAIYTGERVEQDGKIITGKGAGAAKLFSLKLVEVLCGKERADILGASLQ
ncbi:DJ-1/PfpI family protein [Ruminococcaceae bacterium OttesenSCG-928-L11]|nr:DJ-1/PfpI family protein [Ruminococcaceae bacterium OttesenSCG-928-L11]